MRPLDKEFQWVEPYDVLFEQYIDTDLFDLGNSTSEQSGTDDFSKCFELPKSSSGINIPCSSPDVKWEGTPADPRESWQKALCCLEQTSASLAAENRRCLPYSALQRKATTTETKISSLGRSHTPHIESETADSSPPNLTFPNAERRKPGVASQVNDICKPIPAGVSKSTRRVTEFSKMMRGSNYRPGFHDVLAHRTEAMHNPKTPTSSVPLSPPPSSRIEQEEQETLHGNTLKTMNQSLEDTLSPLSHQFQNLSHMTPLATPLLEHSNNQRSSYFGPAALLQYHEQPNYVAQPMHDLMTPPQTQHLSMSAWQPEQQDQETYELDATSPDISSWPTENIAHTGSNAAQDSLRHTSHALSALTNEMPFGSTSNTSAAAATDLATNGLLIDMHGMPGGGELQIGDGSREGLGPSTTGGLSALSPLEQLKLSHTSCTHAYPPPPSIPASASPIDFTTTPSQLRKRQSSAESSPDLSLASTRPRRGSSKAHATHQPHGRQSSTAHPQPQQHGTHRRSKSTSTSARPHRSPTRAHRRHRRTQSSSSPSSAGASGGGMGFVNFTPDDSRKILTGVAPSGSSKTKARREKEAAEKRRKLSAAAVKAVEDAGGDVRVLDGVVLE